MSSRELPSNTYNKNNAGFLLPHLSAMHPLGHLQPLHLFVFLAALCKVAYVKLQTIPLLVHS